MIESGKAPFLKPNPQALANGATVISKAPRVSAEISIDAVKTGLEESVCDDFFITINTGNDRCIIEWRK